MKAVTRNAFNRASDSESMMKGGINDNDLFENNEYTKTDKNRGNVVMCS